MKLPSPPQDPKKSTVPFKKAVNRKVQDSEAGLQPEGFGFGLNEQPHWFLSSLVAISLLLTL